MHSGVTTTSEYTVTDQERMQAAQNYFRWQARMAAAETGRRVLEVGCGIGNFSEHLRDRECVVGIDIVEDCLSRWKERFSGLSHYHGFVMNAEEPEFLSLKKYNPDSIVCLNVLEHIEKDESVLTQMCEVLPAGGRAVLIVPAFEALYGEIDARLGHFRRYTKKSIARLAETAGFRPPRLKYMNAIGFFGWWANARIFKRSEQSAAQIATFDKYIVPISSVLEGWVSPPFGQSILATLEKK